MSDIKQKLQLGAGKGEANKTVFVEAIAHIEALEAKVKTLEKKLRKNANKADKVIAEVVTQVETPKKGFFNRGK